MFLKNKFAICNTGIAPGCPLYSWLGEEGDTSRTTRQRASAYEYAIIWERHKMPPNQASYSSQRLWRSPATKFINPAGAAAYVYGRMPFTDNSCWGIKTFFLENCKKILEISSSTQSRPVPFQFFNE